MLAATQPVPGEFGVPLSAKAQRIAVFLIGEPPMLSKCPTARRHGLCCLKGAGSPAVAPTGGADTNDIEAITAGDP
jgi:hypothetical protein